MESEFDSYEDLEAKVWWLEGINQKLIAENAVLREALMESMEWNWLDERVPPPKDAAVKCEQALSTTNKQAEKMLKVVRAAERMQDSSGDCYEAQAGAERLLMDAVKAYKVTTNK